MMLFEDFVALQKRLAAQRENPEWAMLARYDLLRSKPGMPWRDFLFRKWRAALALLGLAKPYVSGYAWQASLKHVPAQPGSRAVLIWAAAVADRETLRHACREFQKRLAPESGCLPVLLTDVADFAFYSRLGWLVEYLPELSGDGDSYADRKCRYLAWRYRDAVVLPLSAAVLPAAEWDDLLKSD